MKWNLDVDITRASGWQTWQVEADTKEQAIELFEKGDGDVIAEEIEVTNLENFDYSTIYKDGK
ncbi:hypothetical protein KAR91_23715 [Candidatus Pacearchaeota archaeon]|nr:hypothetical protein [Candidatus Pacearchaeota archaeon]